eukprot:1825454-Amphidinium_carterae.1
MQSATLWSVGQQFLRVVMSVQVFAKIYVGGCLDDVSAQVRTCVQPQLGPPETAHLCSNLLCKAATSQVQCAWMLTSHTA